jgi:hypothetical protein
LICHTRIWHIYLRTESITLTSCQKVVRETRRHERSGRRGQYKTSQISVIQRLKGIVQSTITCKRDVHESSCRSQPIRVDLVSGQRRRDIVVEESARHPPTIHLYIVAVAAKFSTVTCNSTRSVEKCRIINGVDVVRVGGADISIVRPAEVRRAIAGVEYHNGVLHPMCPTRNSAIVGRLHGCPGIVPVESHAWERRSSVIGENKWRVKVASSIRDAGLIVCQDEGGAARIQTKVHTPNIVRKGFAGYTAIR